MSDVELSAKAIDKMSKPHLIAALLKIGGREKKELQKLRKAALQSLLKEGLDEGGSPPEKERKTSAKSNTINALEEDENRAAKKRRKGDEALLANLEAMRSKTGTELEQDEAAAKRALQKQVLLRERLKKDTMKRENLKKSQDAQQRLNKQGEVRLDRRLEERGKKDTEVISLTPPRKPTSLDEIETPGTAELEAKKRRIEKKLKLIELEKEEARLEEDAQRLDTRKRKRETKKKKKKTKRKTKKKKSKKHAQEKSELKMKKRRKMEKKQSRKTEKKQSSKKIKKTKRKKKKDKKNPKKGLQRSRTVLNTNLEMYALFRRVAKHVQSLDIEDLDLDADLTMEFSSAVNANAASVRQARAFVVAWKFACDEATLRRRTRWNELCAKVPGISFDGAKNAESAERFCRAVLEKEGFVGEFPQCMYLLSNHLLLTEFKTVTTLLSGESAKFRDKERLDVADYKKDKAFAAATSSVALCSDSSEESSPSSSESDSETSSESESRSDSSESSESSDDVRRESSSSDSSDS